MSDYDDVRAVMDTLQRGYGDATQGVLDAEVARSVIDALRECGWMPPSEIASIVLAAGGEVRMSIRDLDRGHSPDTVLEALRLPDTMETVVRVRS